MRTLGRWLISGVLAVVALLFTVGVIFAFNEKWQAQVIDAVLEESTGWQWDFSSAKIAWNRFSATDVFVMHGGQGFELGEAELGLQSQSLLAGDPFVIRGGHLRECFLDISTLPASALGFTEQEFAEIPSFDEADGAMERLTSLSLQRLQAQGIALEFHDLRVDGRVLLPQGRSLRFNVTIVEASTQAPDDARLRVTSAEFH